MNLLWRRPTTSWSWRTKVHILCSTVQLPALCSWNIILKFPHMMCELRRHSGYADQLGRKELIRPFPHLIGNAVAACHRITQIHRTPTRNSQCTEVLIHFSHHLRNDLILWGCAFWWGDKLLSCLSNAQRVCFLSPYNVTFLLLQFQCLQSKDCWHFPSFVTKSAAAVYFLLCRSETVKGAKNNFCQTASNFFVSCKSIQKLFS